MQILALKFQVIFSCETQHICSQGLILTERFTLVVIQHQVAQYMSDVDIVDNLFGLKVTELDAIKSTSRSDLAATITRLQTAIEAGAISVPNEKNYLSTGVNSF